MKPGKNNADIHPSASLQAKRREKLAVSQRQIGPIAYGGRMFYVVLKMTEEPKEKDRKGKERKGRWRGRKKREKQRKVAETSRKK